WLEKEFLGFIYRRPWEQKAKQTPGVTKGMKTRMCLSKQTLKGLTGNINQVKIKRYLEARKGRGGNPGAGQNVADQIQQLAAPNGHPFARQVIRGYDKETTVILQDCSSMQADNTDIGVDKTVRHSIHYQRINEEEKYSDHLGKRLAAEPTQPTLNSRTSQKETWTNLQDRERMFSELETSTLIVIRYQSRNAARYAVTC
ncbi:Hypp9657, partial [Branchiostoma lanceolatum]